MCPINTTWCHPLNYNLEGSELKCFLENSLEQPQSYRQSVHSVLSAFLVFLHVIPLWSTSRTLFCWSSTPNPPTSKVRFTHSMPFPCRAHAFPLPCRAAKVLECVVHIWFTQCGRVWVTLAMPRPCLALTMPFFSRPRHSTTVERRPYCAVALRKTAWS